MGQRFDRLISIELPILLRPLRFQIDIEVVEVSKLLELLLEERAHVAQVLGLIHISEVVLHETFEDFHVRHLLLGLIYLINYIKLLRIRHLVNKAKLLAEVDLLFALLGVEGVLPRCLLNHKLMDLIP